MIGPFERMDIALIIRAVVTLELCCNPAISRLGEVHEYILKSN